MKPSIKHTPGRPCCETAIEGSCGVFGPPHYNHWRAPAAWFTEGSYGPGGATGNDGGPGPLIFRVQGAVGWPDGTFPVGGHPPSTACMCDEINGDWIVHRTSGAFGSCRWDEVIADDWHCDPSPPPPYTAIGWFASPRFQADVFEDYTPGATPLASPIYSPGKKWYRFQVYGRVGAPTHEFTWIYDLVLDDPAVASISGFLEIPHHFTAGTTFGNPAFSPCDPSDPTTKAPKLFVRAG